MVDLPEARAVLDAAMLASAPFVLVDREWLENALAELERARSATSWSQIEKRRLRS